MSILNKIIDDVFNGITAVKNKTPVEQIDLQGIFKHSMELVEHEPLTGEEKKEAVLSVVNHVLELLEQKGIINDSLYVVLKSAVNTLGGGMIDLVVAASKKLVEINKEVVEGCKAKCFPKKKKVEHK